MDADIETQIHIIEQDAYISVLRAFKAQSDAITWEKESLLTELRKELRVSNEEHGELVCRVNSDDLIQCIREWRKAHGHQPGSLSNPQPIQHTNPRPTVSASRKKHKNSLASSFPIGASSPAFAPALQPISSARQDIPPGERSKKSKSTPHDPLIVVGGEPTEAGTRDLLIGRKVWTRWPDDNHFYEAIITDYNPVEGRHALIYDVNTADETWEWVNLKEISPEDIRWESTDPTIIRKGRRPGAGRGTKKSTSRSGAVAAAGRGRGNLKGQSKKNLPLSQNGTVNKASDDIEILYTDAVITKVEKVFTASHPDPMEIEKAKELLKEHEQALVNAIALLENASDGESGIN